MTLKLRKKSLFPASVTAEAPLILTKTGSLYAFTVDMDDLISQVTAGIPLGTASAYDIGTSGTKVPLLDGANTWSGNQTYTGFVKTSGTGGMGYTTGAGGEITQATNKSTGVTLNKICGQITTNNASLASGTAVSFTFTNSTIAATDTIILNISSGSASGGAYRIFADAIADGSCRISIINGTVGALAEALVINFSVLKAVKA